MFFQSASLTATQIIQTFAKTYYPDLILTEAMLDQLLWLQTNTIITSQSSVVSQPTTVNAEVKRVLSRFYCLRLLEQGDEVAYRRFIQSQSDESALTLAQFTTFAQLIQTLSDASRQCLMASCFITKSDQAFNALPPEKRSQAPADSEQFITYVVKHFPLILPICRELTPEAVMLLGDAFYPDAHARHMLDMEGGHNMLASILAGINTTTFTKERFNLWFARWILNVAGLDGHISHHGSSYLTRHVADCMHVLKSELDHLWDDPTYPVLQHYLNFRAKQLGLTHPTIAYLGALMRQYTPEIGRQIEAWFESLSEEEKDMQREVFRLQLEQTKVTSTYKPTILVNLLALHCSVSDALSIFIKIERQAMCVHHAAIQAGEVSPSTPLCYRDVAFKEYLEPIKTYFEEHGQIPQLVMDSNGYLKVEEAVLHQALNVMRGC